MRTAIEDRNNGEGSVVETPRSWSVALAGARYRSIVAALGASNSAHARAVSAFRVQLARPVRGELAMTLRASSWVRIEVARYFPHCPPEAAPTLAGSSSRRRRTSGSWLPRPGSDLPPAPVDYNVMSTDEFVQRYPVDRAFMVVGLVRGLDVSTLDLRALRDMQSPVFLVAERLGEPEQVTLLHAGVYDVVRRPPRID